MAQELWMSGFSEDESLQWCTGDEPTCIGRSGNTCNGDLVLCQMPKCNHLICERHSYNPTINGAEYEGICKYCRQELQQFPMPRMERMPELMEVA